VTGVRAALYKEVTVPAVNVGSTRSGFRDSTMMICHSFQSKLLPNAFPDLFDWAVVNALRFMFDQPAPKRFDESSAAVHQRDLVIVDVAVVPRRSLCAAAPRSSTSATRSAGTPPSTYTPSRRP
jgi:hypothetical protein